MTLATLNILINAATAILIIGAIVADKVRYKTVAWLIDSQEEELLRLSDLVTELQNKLEELSGVEDEVDRRIDLIKEEIDERVDNAVDNKTSDLESRIDDFESEDEDVTELKRQVKILNDKVDNIRIAFSGLISDLED